MAVLDMFSRVRLPLALFLVVLGSVACGSSTPSGPSAMATIQGTVNPASGASGSSDVSAASGAVASGSHRASITVSVVGTGLSTTTDSSGSFTLTGVPEGTVKLRFQGPGIDATLEISGVTAGQTLTITVHVSGSSAEMDDDHGNHDNNDGDDDGDGDNGQQQCAAVGAKAEIEGQINAITDTSVTVFQQGDGKGNTLCQVTTSTRIRKGNKTLTLDQLSIGSRVHVKGTGLGPLSNGDCEVVADEIKLQ